MQGIDISSWQAGLDLNQVPFDFVIVKATGGTHYVNPYCDSWVQQAKEMGKPFAFYHFASEGSYQSPEAEAEYFVRNTENYFGQGIPILDFEDPNTLGMGVSWAKPFLDRVVELTDVNPLFYVYKSHLQSYDYSAISGKNGLWYAQYANYDRTGYQTDPWTDGGGLGSWDFAAMFQYTSSGLLGTYQGNLDLSVFYGNEATWNAYAGKTSEGIALPKPPVEQPTPGIQLATPEMVAVEVAKRLWGDGTDRIERLQAAGHNPDAVQAAVNELYSDPNKLAGLVLIGAFGTGELRKQYLGDQFDAVQAIVNKLV
jgi:GH25 family lysozyme M1 (1,4-beta-N-acetylmuramidase)